MSTSLLAAARIPLSKGRRHLLESSFGNDKKCSLCSADRSRKRRRGKLPLPSTKKDRIRSLEKKPEPTLEMPSIDKVGETVERRLTQAQEFVFKLWRGDKGPRAERKGPVMDQHWWFWNIMLMSLPGIMIGLYCEFIAKPEMHELLSKLDEEQRARILGGTLEAEEEFHEMGTEDVHRLQKSVNEEIESDNGDITLLALKQRLDLLEAQLKKKDRQLDHLRRYQLERTQQSGIQNRIEDKMIAEWKSQGNTTIEVVEKTTDDATLTERMKEAVIHGIVEKLDAKMKSLKDYGEKGLEYGRRLMTGEEATAPAPLPESRDGDKRSNENVIEAAFEAASYTTRAAEGVSSSMSSSDPKGMAQAAKNASDAAADASRAAQAAADAAASQGQPESQGFLRRQWNKLLRKN